MLRFLYKFSITILIVLILFLVYLSTIGLETDRFDTLIKKNANSVNDNVKFDFNKTNIYLDIRGLKLLVKLKKPKIIIKDNEINLLKLNLYLSLKSFYKSNFLLERANIGFAKNSIKDLAKVTNFFLPKIINNQLKKVFVEGNL
jgi:hypothetical protein